MVSKKDLPMDILESMYRRITQPFTKGTIPEIKLKVPYKESFKVKCIIRTMNS